MRAQRSHRAPSTRSTVGTLTSSTAQFTVGLRGEHDSPQGSVLVPALGGQIRLGSFRLAANYADTFRVPTIDDLYYPGFSNPLLQPERSHNLDATAERTGCGGRQHFSSTGSTGKPSI